METAKYTYLSITLYSDANFKNEIGYYTNPNSLDKKKTVDLKLLKLNSIIHIHTSITWNIKTNEIYIFTDSGRLIRPILVLNNKKNKLVWRTFKPTCYYKNAYRNGWHTPHPAFFIKKTSIKENFDEALQISSDFDFMFKHQEIFNLNSKPIEIICTIMSNDGISQSFKNIIKGNINVIKSIKRFYKNENFLIFIIKRFLFKLRSTL